MSVVMFVVYPTFSLQLTGQRFFHLWILFCIAHWPHWAQQILNAYSANLLVNCGRLSVRKPRIQSESARHSPMETRHISLHWFLTPKPAIFLSVGQMKKRGLASSAGLRVFHSWAAPMQLLVSPVTLVMNTGDSLGTGVRQKMEICVSNI